MRISDWSSDVCSSDLPVADRLSAWLGLDAENAEAAGFATVIALTTYVSLIAGELVPKQFALRAPEPIAIFMAAPMVRSEEHTSELQSLMRISYAVFCLKKKTHKIYNHTKPRHTQ